MTHTCTPECMTTLGSWLEHMPNGRNLPDGWQSDMVRVEVSDFGYDDEAGLVYRLFLAEYEPIEGSCRCGRPLERVNGDWLHAPVSYVADTRERFCNPGSDTVVAEVDLSAETTYQVPRLIAHILCWYGSADQNGWFAHIPEEEPDG